MPGCSACRPTPTCQPRCAPCAPRCKPKATKLSRNSGCSASGAAPHSGRYHPSTQSHDRASGQLIAPWQVRPPAHGNYLFSDRARAAYSAHSVRGPQPRASEKRSLREPGGHGPPRPCPADAGCTHHDRSPSAHPPGHGGVVGAADAGLHRGDAPGGRRRPDRSRAGVLVDPGVRRGHHHGVRAHPQRRQPALCRPVAHAVPDRLCDCLQRGGLCDRRPRAALRHPFSRSS